MALSHLQTKQLLIMILGLLELLDPMEVGKVILLKLFVG